MAGGAVRRRIRLGCQGLEVTIYTGPRLHEPVMVCHRFGKPEEEMRKLIRHAANSGITFLDTDDCYGPPH
ncbi:hypothetical protein Nepgr_020478 [Nepenthes gracilis]|uniref:NADP-dependent oxidoreductase domain-containing protein n=1 Tax=Nepenthes gracilis TaxID=150966 RepID=A0AAD3SX25_NEPGR|nr:hypothetical protein Nepgr_020478 [Nepenthes gracilis]